MALLLALPLAGAELARFSGSVVSEQTSQPLRRATVTLRSVRAGGASISTTTDARGRFELHGIPPGPYSLAVARDGYLPDGRARIGDFRVPPQFLLRPGDVIENVAVRLRPWGVVAGKVRYDDAEPAVGAQIQVLEEYRSRGRHGFRLVAATRANDRGEYRIYGLPPGDYIIAARYDREPAAPETEDRSLETYGIVYYPSAVLVTEALAVRVKSGEEQLGLDVYFKSVRKQRVAGWVTSGASGARLRAPSLAVEQLDSDGTAVLRVPAEVRLEARGGFEIRGVPPGRYRLVAEGSENGVRLVGRRPVTVGEAPVEGFELVAAPEQNWTLTVTGLEAPELRTVRLTLEPRSAAARAVAARPVKDSPGVFEATLDSDEVYDVYLESLPPDFFQKELRRGDERIKALATERGSPPGAVTVVAAKSAVSVAGQVAAEGWRAASGAIVTLIPDPPAGRLADYRETFSDERGLFELRGVAPGRYRVVAWVDSPPCDFYDQAALEACNGFPVEVTQAGRYVIGLRVQGDY
jgi:hypothetical protein